MKSKIIGWTRIFLEYPFYKDNGYDELVLIKFYRNESGEITINDGWYSFPKSRVILLYDNSSDLRKYVNNSKHLGRQWIEQLKAEMALEELKR